MGGGWSQSENDSYQDAFQSISQGFDGQCDFSCTNNISNFSLYGENDTIEGGITIEQACNVNGNCMMQNYSDTAASVAFAASQSAGASSAAGFLENLNVDIADNQSYQTTRQITTQAVQRNSDFTSTNNMENVVIFLGGSTITGGIDVAQNGSVAGSVALKDMMSASADATGQVEQAAESGKFALDSTQLLELLGFALAVIIVLVITVVVVRYFIQSGKTNVTAVKTTTSSPSASGGERIIIYAGEKTPDIRIDGDRVEIGPPEVPYKPQPVPGISPLGRSLGPTGPRPSVISPKLPPANLALKPDFSQSLLAHNRGISV